MTTVWSLIILNLLGFNGTELDIGSVVSVNNSDCDGASDPLFIFQRNMIILNTLVVSARTITILNFNLRGKILVPTLVPLVLPVANDVTFVNVPLELQLDTRLVSSHLTVLLSFTERSMLATCCFVTDELSPFPICPLRVGKLRGCKFLESRRFYNKSCLGHLKTKITLGYAIVVLLCQWADNKERTHPFMNP